MNPISLTPVRLAVGRHLLAQMLAQQPEGGQDNLLAKLINSQMVNMGMTGIFTSLRASVTRRFSASAPEKGSESDFADPLGGDIEIPEKGSESDFSDPPGGDGRLVSASNPLARPSAAAPKGMSSDEVSRADFFFDLADEAKTGNLTADQVKFTLSMMGHEGASAEVAHILHKFDMDGDGKINKSEFREVVAAAPEAFLTQTLGSLDQGKLRKIDAMTMGKIEGLHPGYAELSDFLRALKSGMAVHRVDMAGNSCPTHLSLTPALDGIVIHHG